MKFGDRPPVASRDFNSKLEAFGCAKKNISGAMLKNIQSHLHLTDLNTDEHTHLDKRTGNTDIFDMAFISPNLTKHDIQFLIGDDLGSDHLPIKIIQLWRDVCLGGSTLGT